MGTAHLKIDLDAICENWQALNNKSGGRAAAVVKANAYGLGVRQVGRALAAKGVNHFFVAVAEEGVTLRNAIGKGPRISIFSGHMTGDTTLIRDFELTPMINSVDQLLRHVEALPGHGFGIQIDTGMNRLGMSAVEFQALRELIIPLHPVLLMSHLACADDAAHEMNQRQFNTFSEMTQGLNMPRSLAATGGILLGPEYHFDLTRPGVGLYGGHPFEDAKPVVELDIPVIQIREINAGSSVGYSNTYIAPTPRQIATISAGYADGLIRAMGPNINLFHNGTPCPVVGRISMDLIGVDVTICETPPEQLQLLSVSQGVDDLADAAGTIGYEILTSLGHRYARSYVGENF